MNELSPRGTTVCRGCGGAAPRSVLDLGRQPLSNEMALSQADEDPTFPLHLRVCPACGLGQIGEYVLPERIFGADYPYLSSVSSSWLEHAGRYVATMLEELNLGPDDLLLEIASNDGYLLEQAQRRGVRVLGVEPATAVADIARAKGVPTESEFFGLDTARALVAEHGHPRLVAANNVMAHVPDLEDFTAGLAHLCDDHTVITVENPSFVTLLQETQFDTIYHEHFSYLTAHALSRAVELFGLELVRVQKLTTHGGSNRYWFTRRGMRQPDASVAAVISEELSGGLLDEATWEAFAVRSRATIQGLRTWIDQRHDAGRSIAGYGAAAKGNTLLNAAGVMSTDLAVVADGSRPKQGTFLPGSHVPVVAPTELGEHAVDDVLILPWNIEHEIAPLVRDLVPDATSWVAVPSMHRV